MLKFIVLSMSIFFVQQGCRKLGLCEDGEFNFPRQENTSNKIRLNGYYYGDLTGNNPSTPSVYLLYKDGISYSGLGTYNINEIEDNSLVLSITDDKRNSKSGWGIYKIENNSIEIQNWSFSTGCKPITILEGEILNDTTIRISFWKNSNSDKQHIVNSIFLFHEYSPKPDSTNNFIK